jgi:ATP-dependent Clp protease ATP-binding subunit ClpA
MLHQFTRDNRAILGFAYQEAADLGHTTLGNDHLILGILCNARIPAFNTLGEQGLTLAQAREVVRNYHQANDVESDPDKDRIDEDRDALAAIGIDLDKVREAVKGAFGDDITDNWGKRRGGRGRPGGPDRSERPERGPHGPHGRRHGGPRGRRGDGGPWERPEGDEPWVRPDGESGPGEGGRGRRGPRGRGRRPQFSKDAKAAITHAAVMAKEAGRDIAAEDVLLGILTTGDAASRALIESTTTVEALRSALQPAAAK